MDYLTGLLAALPAIGFLCLCIARAESRRLDRDIHARHS